jgi:BirA family biotin operon repressor/biotin-[acetyl-CoA-carboxylase] ligase
LTSKQTEQERLPDGFVLYHLDKVSSTNDEATKLAAQGAPSGTVVLADTQTSGRGRLGRAWQSRPGNLQASFVLRPDCALRSAGQLSLLAGVALAEALIEHGPDGLDLRLKWPNDVLISGAKVAGILLESAGDRSGRLDHVVLGIGLNIVWSPTALSYPVTSLNAVGFEPRVPKDWLSAIASSLRLWLDRWQSHGFDGVKEAWRARSYGLGGAIRLRLDGKDLDGRFVDLTETGALLIERPDGGRHEVTAGDVIFAGP